jgi:uncharacterized protein (TIGR02145 family)
MFFYIMKMKGIIWLSAITVLSLVVIITNSCVENEPEPGHPPVLSTKNIFSLSPTTVYSGGEVTSDGGSAVTEKGLCWNTIQSPTIYDNKIVAGAGTGHFKSKITGLTPSSTYYIRAYATNNIATSYGNEFVFKTYTDTISDVDGNNYNIMSIGTQRWMAENLKTTRYNDNTSIPMVSDNFEWAALSSPGYCWYENDSSSFKSVYGALYNWYVVEKTTNDGKNVCPAGWHVPSDDDWSILISFLGGDSIAGGKMKESHTFHWTSPNTGATNESGFTGLPAGARLPSGRFKGVKTRAGWWSSTELFANSGRGRYLYYEYSMVYRGSGFKMDGFSIRCVKD